MIIIMRVEHSIIPYFAHGLKILGTGHLSGIWVSFSQSVKLGTYDI